MILYKYIFKDIIKVQVVTLVVLASVFLCQTVIKYLGQASSGSFPMKVVTELVAYSMPSIGFILIPMTLYVGIIVSLSSMSSDSEMVVMRASGISGVTFVKITLVLAVISAIVTGINCFYLMPASNEALTSIKDNAQNDPNYLPIESGKFTDFGPYTLYIHHVSNQKTDKTLDQIFVLRRQESLMNLNDGFSFLSASSGSLRRDATGIYWLNLKNGILYRSSGEKEKLEEVSFTDLSVPIPFSPEDDNSDESLKSVSTLKLMSDDSPAAQIELQWRVAPVLACFIFAIMAVPLSMINPRQGRFTRLGPAIILFVSYYLALLSVRNLLNNEKIGIYPGMYLVPILFIIFVLIPLNREKKFFKKNSKSKG